MRPRSTFTLAMVLPLAAAAAGQSQAKPPYTFRASTRLVEINVIVDGRAGPVAGLTASDFTLTDNGQPRSIQIFSANDERERAAAAPVAASPASGLGATAAAAPGAAYSNTRRRAPSMVAVLLDALNARDGTWYCGPQPLWTSAGSFERARMGALHFVAQLDPNVRVALYGLDTQLRVLSDFTSDRAQLIAALRTYQPRLDPRVKAGNTPAAGASGPFAALVAQANEEYQKTMVRPLRVEGTVPALQAISEHLAGVPGRISLVWIMNGPPLSGEAVEAALARANIAVYTVDARGLLARDGEVAAGLGPPSIGNVCGHGKTRQNSLPPGLPEMQDVAAMTGGRAFINTNDIGAAIARAAADSRASYTLGFYVDAAGLDNQFHSVHVQVRGRDRQVRYPHGYWARRDQEGGTARGVAALQAALRSPLEATALPLQARLVRTGSDGSAALHLTATLDIHQLSLQQVNGRRVGSVVLATVAQSAAGAVLQSSRALVRLQWSEAGYQRRLRSGFQFEQTVAPPAGTATLRLIAEDPASMAVGSLIIPMGKK